MDCHHLSANKIQIQDMLFSTYKLKFYIIIDQIHDILVIVVHPIISEYFDYKLYCITYYMILKIKHLD